MYKETNVRNKKVAVHLQMTGQRNCQAQGMYLSDSLVSIVYIINSIKNVHLREIVQSLQLISG